MLNNVEYLPSVAMKSPDVLEYNKLNDWPDVPAQAKVFAHEYTIIGSLKNACDRVGITKAAGSRLLRDPLINAYLVALQEGILNETTIITRQFVEIQLLETLEQVNGDVEVPMVSKDGDMFMGKQFQASSKISLLKEMSQFAGMKKDAGVNGHGVTINIDLGAAGYRPEGIADCVVVSEQ